MRHDELKHYKYIKRWREGKEWKYQYPTDKPNISKGNSTQRQLIVNRNRWQQINKNNTKQTQVIKNVTRKKKINETKSNIEKGKEILSQLSNKTIGQLEKKIEKGMRVVASKLVKQQYSEYITKKIDERKQNVQKNKEEKLNAPTKEAALLNDKIQIKDPLPGLDLQTSYTTQKQDMALTNPNYDPTNSLYSENCGLCVIAYDLRRRGYDVEAKGNDEGLSNYAMEECYFKPTDEYTLLERLMNEDPNLDTKREIRDNLIKKTVLQETKSDSEYAKSIEKAITSHGDGTRGIIGVSWDQGGGHFMNWEVKNGKVTIIDAQLNATYTVEKLAAYTKNAYCIRTDNVEPSEEVLQYVQNRKKKETK